MLADTNERPNVQEQYETAGNTSNLSIEAEKRGAGDVLIAAGWSQSRLGLALLRLHSEWSAAAKPRRVGQPGVAAIAERIKADDLQAAATAERRGEPVARPGAVKVRAQEEADRWFTNELRLLANSLKSRGAVWDQLSGWVAVNGICPEIGAAALLHWLHPVCHHCEGHGLRKVPNQPALSARQCSKCNGTGHKPHPHGSAKVLVFLDDCAQKARQSLQVRLRPGG